MYPGRRCRCSINQKPRYVSVSFSDYKKKQKPQRFGFESTFISYYVSWLPWQPVDPLFRAPGDEEAQEENLIVSKGETHILTLCQLLSPLVHPMTHIHNWVSLWERPEHRRRGGGGRVTPSTCWTALYVCVCERERTYKLYYWPFLQGIL